MNKRIFILINLICTLLITSIGCFQLFKEGHQQLLEIDLKRADEAKLIIYKTDSNAATNETIQIRLSTDKNTAIKVFEHYDLLIGHEFAKGLLTLVLQDTSGSEVQVDTFTIEIQSLQSM